MLFETTIFQKLFWPFNIKQCVSGNSFSPVVLHHPPLLLRHKLMLHCTEKLLELILLHRLGGKVNERINSYDNVKKII